MEQSIIQTEYSELMQKSYIDYAMSVIISRALPDCLLYTSDAADD